ncbi:MAG: Glu-tRNA(Gln) amidotransferase subunit GatE [Candidatus Thermoplasmatota archaeon]|nr:Glu-tRNA(Gln) amidotransferase subunit GatE [Candidatus Thermoplasmatota archaeon]MEC8073279.1 Glu-tRNA(Gln) amidotransferase subunit GatE [Candidatus Thermoplasmatota archaeon]MEC8077048.1 Glu-tRNA(Gln) amidotransferase subunit GatE [Candidatus Thermoplasmatota archaeon]MEC8446153.1 Glu-tRNA(Gln) amidotransferase subunit GatE [Candidatus Thermoplasmatota archaeon]
MTLKAGLEIHQQLNSGKLFCNCSLNENGKDYQFKRKLHATSSELGDIDIAAKTEQIKLFTYYNKSCNCLVYTDEEPPRGPNRDAVKVALQFAQLVDAKIVEEIHFMRKVVVDGSNTSGFQRTGLIATGGRIEYDDKILELDQLCLEEDSCRHGEEEHEYLLDRLGVPLLEITTKPQLDNSQDVQKAAKAIGRLLRACNVKRGLGTIRQDVNVSINNGQRVELKGFQDLASMPKVVENEMKRQFSLNEMKKGKVGQPISVDNCFKKKREFSLALKIENWNGILGNKNSPKGHVRMGRELADYAKRAGLKGIMHSDELPAYGIDNEETKNIKLSLGCNDNDAFILIFGKEKITEKAMEIIIERINTKGVPKEVRKVTPENLTRYMRPMPGASRMYPETDIAPFKLTNLNVRKPKTLDEREKDLPLNEEESKQLVSNDLDEQFNILNRKFDLPKLLSRILLHTLPQLKDEGETISNSDLEKVLILFQEGVIVKEGISKALVQSSRNEEIQVNNDNVEVELEDFIVSLVREKKEFIKERGMGAVGALMGPVMSKFRGKMDGGDINKVLMEKVKEIL